MSVAQKNRVRVPISIEIQPKKIFKDALVISTDFVCQVLE